MNNTHARFSFPAIQGVYSYNKQLHRQRGGEGPRQQTKPSTQGHNGTQEPTPIDERTPELQSSQKEATQRRKGDTRAAGSTEALQTVVPTREVSTKTNVPKMMPTQKRQKRAYKTLTCNVKGSGTSRVAPPGSHHIPLLRPTKTQPPGGEGGGGVGWRFTRFTRGKGHSYPEAFVAVVTTVSNVSAAVGRDDEM